MNRVHVEAVLLNSLGVVVNVLLCVCVVFVVT